MCAVILELDEPDASLDLVAAVRSGIRGLRLTWPCLLTADDAPATLAVVRLLREATSDGVPVRWHGRVGEGVDPQLLVHLDPPEPTPGEEADRLLSDWRGRHRPGLCYYRIGPDFVLVKDVRRPNARARFRIDGVVDAFRALEAVVDVTRLEAATVDVLDGLESEGLVFKLGSLATLLPSRMRRWPVPALDV